MSVSNGYTHNGNREKNSGEGKTLLISILFKTELLYSKLYAQISQLNKQALLIITNIRVQTEILLTESCVRQRLCLESASGYTAAILVGYNKHKKIPKVRDVQVSCPSY
jgi:hypothetical protein